MRLRHLLTLGLLVGLLVALPEAVAQAASVWPGRMMTSADVPTVLGSPRPDSSVLVTLPARGGIELCDALVGGWRVQVPGPPAMTQVIVPTSATSTSAVSELAYVFPSTTEAERAYARLVTAFRKCNAVASGSQPGGGKVTTTITTGSFPGITAHPQVWVNHRDVYTGSKSSKQSEDVGLSVFTQSRNAVLVTMDTTMTNGSFSQAERRALGRLAQDLSERWYSTAPITIAAAASTTTVNLVVGQQAHFSGLPLRGGQDLNVTADPTGVVTITRTTGGTPVISAISPGTTKVTVAYDEAGTPVANVAIIMAAV